MKLSDYKISLDILKSQSQYSLPMKKGDTARVIYIALRQGGVPFEIGADCFAVISGKKPDGTVIENNCVISDNTIIYTITPQTTAVSGLVECEIKLYGNDNALISSPRFTIVVDERAVGENEIISANEYSALTALYSGTNELKNDLQDKLESGYFKGEKGDKGDKGDTGEKGEQGIQGIQGTKGDKGDKGEKGDKGDKGEQGIQGIKGDKGDTPTLDDVANALKGKETGEIISTPDVSPIEHDINLKLESKNLIPFKNQSYKNGQYVAGQTYEINGVSFTVNDDGSVYAVGTATGSYSIFYLYTATTLSKGNDVVTLSGSPEGSSATTYFLRFRNDSAATGIYEDYGNGVTINNANVLKSSIAIIVLQGQSIDATFFPKLEYGNTSTEYTAPVDPSTVTVTRRGGNFADIPNQKFTKYSVGMQNFTQWYIDLPIGTEITISADCNTADADNGTVGWNIKLNNSTSTIQIWRGRITNGKTNRISYTHIKTVDFSAADMTYSLLYLGYASENDKTFENITVNIGNKDLGFEPYTDGDTFTPNADGTVTGIRSTTPNMIFSADTKGVNLTCEYNKDINKVIEYLVNAIISLGGNV